MRSAADFRAPGVYATFAPPQRAALEIADTRVTGIVGLTQKGPINVPVRVSNWDEFVETFGYTDLFYTSDTVFAHFTNGGGPCWITRVAHVPPAGEAITADHASCAEHTQTDDWKKPSLKIRALDEGTWGNNIWVKCEHHPGPSTLMTRDLDIGAGEAHVKSTRGFEVGSLVRIYDRENSDYVVLTEIGDRLVKWGKETPVNRRHRAAAPTHLEVLEFDLHVTLKDRKEVFKGLQMHPSSRNYAPRIVEQRSRLVRLVDLFTKSPVPHNLPGSLPLTKLAGGRDGAEKLTTEDVVGVDFGPSDRRGMLGIAAIEEVAVMSCPDAMLFYEREPGPAGELKAQRLQDQMIAICENQKDRFAILDIPHPPVKQVPASQVVEWAKSWRRRTDSSFCAYYWPWIKSTTVAGTKRNLPPSGYITGVIGARDQEEGVHVAPANQAMVGAEDLSLRVSEDDLGQLNHDAVNTFRLQRGVRPWGARSASSDPSWRYLTVRRLFIMLRRSLETGFSWVTFEPNDTSTWDTLQRTTSEFLMDLWKRGMLVGGKAEEAFFVKCDAETNPQDNIDQGLLVCDIGVAPVSPTEFIMVSLVQEMGTPG
ncbi:MAG TPA: phage tail sheath C-terminal domain-containing protein [Kofleriaceae bacterium]|nr:phage tail sheath C-terminal domain-containing protein [Kofleriaceae bacterium]